MLDFLRYATELGNKTMHYNTKKTEKKVVVRHQGNVITLKTSNGAEVINGTRKDALKLKRFLIENGFKVSMVLVGKRK